MSEPTRDFLGYGDTPPTGTWPGGAALAVNFCINYEEGGERCILDGDDGSEDRLADVRTPRRMGERNLNIESSYEYGARVGYWRLLNAFTQRGLQATVNVVGLAAQKNASALSAMIAQGFDLQPHGWRWIDQSTLSEEQERAAIADEVAQIERLTGARPLGYYAGLPSINTRRLLVEAGGFLFDSDVYNDDCPYWSPDYPGLLLMPYSLDTNDSRFGRAESAYQIGSEWVTYLTDSFEVLLAEARAMKVPRMMTVGLHARLLGRPGRIGALHKVLDRMMAEDDVWIARRGDMARSWADTHPDPRL